MGYLYVCCYPGCLCHCIQLRHEDVAVKAGFTAVNCFGAAFLMLKILSFDWLVLKVKRNGRHTPSLGRHTPSLGATHPVLRATHPVLRSTHHVIGATHPVLRATHPVLRATHPVLRATHSVLRVDVDFDF
jgi:hypothetical protein